MPFIHAGAPADPATPRKRRGRLLGWASISRATIALAVVSLTAAPGWSAAQADQAAAEMPVLELAEALNLAEQRSQTLLAQDASIRAARELAVAAGRLPDPMLGISVDNVPIEGSNRFSLDAEAMTMRSLSLSQTFTRAAKRESRSQRFEQEAALASAARRVRLAELRTSTARAWLDRYYQEQLIALLAAQHEAAMRTAAAVEAAYRGNRASQEQVLAARTAAARIKDRQWEADAELHNAQSTLSRWIGEPAARRLGPAPRITTTRLGGHELTEDLAHHPELALIDAQERLALAEAAVARAEKSADWTLSVKWGIRDDRFDDMLSVGLSVPLQWNQASRQDRELAAKLEQAHRVRAEREETRRAHLADLQRMLATWRSNLSRLADYDRSLIPLAKDRTHAAEAAFGAGNGSLASALETRRMEIDTQIERLRIERQTALLWAELEYLIVEPDPDSGATGPRSGLTTEARHP